MSILFALALGAVAFAAHITGKKHAAFSSEIESSAPNRGLGIFALQRQFALGKCPWQAVEAAIKYADRCAQDAMNAKGSRWMMFLLRNVSVVACAIMVVAIFV